MSDQNHSDSFELESSISSFKIHLQVWLIETSFAGYRGVSQLTRLPKLA
jgi:hypothetical protein